MRVKEHIGGYNLWLSVGDTLRWANKAGAAWPCSQLEGHRLFVGVDRNGLCDLTIDGKDSSEIDSNELSACIADHLPDNLKQFWPAWFYE